MNWFFIALGAPFLWAIVNHADKYLLSKYFKGKNVGALLIFSTLVAILVLPTLYFINPSVLQVSPRNITILIIAGIISSTAVAFYLYALKEDETSVVIPLFQIIPIFSFILAFIILGETLTVRQIIGSILIICGSIFIAMDIGKKFALKGRVLGLMVGSSFLFALYETIFKFVAVDEGFIVSSFWEYTGLFIVGVFFFTFVKNYRRQFIGLIKLRPIFMLSYNTASEILTVAGNLLTNFAILLAPVTLVLSVANLQPMFVFILGILITLFLPKIAREKISRTVIFQKIISLVIIICGSYFLNY
ncbi:MAG: hypothetical protein A3G52_00970 [Candidatus Taylorbacteria bacterium RIFCSPLOWO2_12_FULL_43_20]|uniref:EamA domain-containing protein n=1 Tax=Candidatus Taylorbacteria bacterium RIFCSPLOWO2_12_FULL_43_20 TaxID=1802332 RepID=A0A1G2P1V0_9BACT|nr:MAG: hypothetical protein A2825_01390 [Candidatus Taylorbacteria bacterium RIFCSPHIGHO2_01_FULL_43_120]OHA38058.1 MAG: hypothetical protein A3H58_01110 [Candidatus Taylorbacteria bacterium RIFCSPLOWO2_02_FULL_43_22b]OHA41699.1 MAG: hypothetical protein A3G52_00970 [Candidatus Taylorbacteria bacterium RIFCSPLOWO2_12_FULL_43_20]